MREVGGHIHCDDPHLRIVGGGELPQDPSAVVGPSKGAFDQHVFAAVDAGGADLVDQRGRLDVYQRGQLPRRQRVPVGKEPAEQVVGDTVGERLSDQIVLDEVRVQPPVTLEVRDRLREQRRLTRTRRTGRDQCGPALRSGVSVASRYRSITFLRNVSRGIEAAYRLQVL